MQTTSFRDTWREIQLTNQLNEGDFFMSKHLTDTEVLEICHQAIDAFHNFMEIQSKWLSVPQAGNDFLDYCRKKGLIKREDDIFWVGSVFLKEVAKHFLGNSLTDDDSPAPTHHES